ncbi:DUF2335 domain-containing protein [Dellaglioa sp. L3N]
MENNNENSLANNSNNLDKDDQEILDQVKNLPISENEKEDIIATMEMYSGPIPHPKILAGYQALYPDAAEKIIENGLEESRHRRTLETARQKRRGNLAWASMIILTIVCVVFMIFSFELIMTGHTAIGSVFGAGSFLTFLGTLVNNVTILSGNNDISSENNDKDN